jgi:hypothetical protein
MAGTPILGAPLPNSPATLAYAPPPAAGSRLSTAA